MPLWETLGLGVPAIAEFAPEPLAASVLPDHGGGVSQFLECGARDAEPRGERDEQDQGERAEDPERALPQAAEVRGEPVGDALPTVLAPAGAPIGFRLSKPRMRRA